MTNAPTMNPKPATVAPTPRPTQAPTPKTILAPEKVWPMPDAQPLVVVKPTINLPTKTTTTTTKTPTPTTTTTLKPTLAPTQEPTTKVIEKAENPTTTTSSISTIQIDADAPNFSTQAPVIDSIRTMKAEVTHSPVPMTETVTNVPKASETTSKSSDIDSTTVGVTTSSSNLATATRNNEGIQTSTNPPVKTTVTLHISTVEQTTTAVLKPATGVPRVRGVGKPVDSSANNENTGQSKLTSSNILNNQLKQSVTNDQPVSQETTISNIHSTSPPKTDSIPSTNNDNAQDVTTEAALNTQDSQTTNPPQTTPSINSITSQGYTGTETAQADKTSGTESLASTAAVAEKSADSTILSSDRAPPRTVLKPADVAATAKLVPITKGAVPVSIKAPLTAKPVTEGPRIIVKSSPMIIKEDMTAMKKENQSSREATTTPSHP